jgi:hypothetical protein
MGDGTTFREMALASGMSSGRPRNNDCGVDVREIGES